MTRWQNALWETLASASCIYLYYNWRTLKRKKKPSRPKGIIKWKENRHPYIFTEVILTVARGPLWIRVLTMITKVTPIHPWSG